MKALVEELLLLARLDEGMSLHRRPVDLTALAEDVLQDAHSTNPSRHITTRPRTRHPAPRETKPPSVESSATSSPTHSSIPRPTPISPFGSHDERIAASSRSETPVPGMTPADAAHAFDRFWRAETSRTRTGSGLGLPIAQAIVNAHGGTIHLETTSATWHHRAGRTAPRIRTPVADTQPSTATRDPTTRPAYLTKALPQHWPRAGGSVSINGLTGSALLRVNLGYFVGSIMRSGKAIVKAFTAPFHRFDQRRRPLPVGSRLITARYTHLSAACSLGK